MPAAVFYVILGNEVINVIYGRGAFAATYTTARVLIGYSIGLFSVGSYNFLQRFFYSINDYRTPFLIALLVAAIDIVLSLWLKETALRVVGLAVANSAAFTCGLAVMLWTARKRLNGLRGRYLLGIAGRGLISLVVSGGVLYLYRRFVMSFIPPNGSWVAVAAVIVGFVIFSSFTVFGYYLTGVEAVRDLLSRRRRHDR